MAAHPTKSRTRFGERIRIVLDRNAFGSDGYAHDAIVQVIGSRPLLYRGSDDADRDPGIVGMLEIHDDHHGH